MLPAATGQRFDDFRFTAHADDLSSILQHYVIDLVDMPTPGAKPTLPVSPLLKADVPSVFQMGPEALRVSSAAELEQHLFHNPYFSPDALFALRYRPEGPPLAVGILVQNPAYAHPKQVDAAMPCFRLGAFGTEGMSAKRINGLFSFFARTDRDVMPLGLDLLGLAAFRLQDSELDSFAAQVPSDVPHLQRFYQRLFRKQGSFPVLERKLREE